MYEKLRDKNVNIDRNVETVATYSDKVNDGNDRELEFRDASAMHEQSSDGTTNNAKVSEVGDNSSEKPRRTLTTTRKTTAPNIELEILADKHDEAPLHPDPIPIPDDDM